MLLPGFFSPDDFHGRGANHAEYGLANTVTIDALDVFFPDGDDLHQFRYRNYGGNEYPDVQRETGRCLVCLRGSIGGHQFQCIRFVPDWLVPNCFFPNGHIQWRQ